MDASVTIGGIDVALDVVAQILLIVGALAGVYAGFHRHVEKRAKEAETRDAGLEDRIRRAEEALAAFKLDVAQNYASNPALRQMEDRLSKSLDRLVEGIDQMRSEIVDVRKDMNRHYGDRNHD